MILDNVSTHSRPKAAGALQGQGELFVQVSTHSRPKAAGQLLAASRLTSKFQLTAARRRLGCRRSTPRTLKSFQLTAARRRLECGKTAPLRDSRVSTHSRPKAAGRRPAKRHHQPSRFNSQPPEGGWAPATVTKQHRLPFQLTAARRRLAPRCSVHFRLRSFNSQPPEGGWFQT